MGWEPHIVAELDAMGFHEVLADFHAPMQLPAHAPARALTRVRSRAGARAHECLRRAINSACPRAGASASLSGMDGRR